MRIALLKEKVKLFTVGADVRTKKRTIQTAYSYFFKGISVTLTFLVLSATFKELSTESYGIWLTINSLANMISFMDIGIGNGLRNRLGTAIALNKLDIARKLVSTAYVTLTIMCLTIVILMSFFINIIDWESLFNTKLTAGNELKISVFVVLATIVINFIFNLANSIFQSIQQSSKSALLLIISNTIFLLFIHLSHYLISDNNLISISTCFILANIISGLIINITLFIKHKNLSPKLKLFDKYKLREISGMGFKFLILQLSPIILIYSDNLIISKFIGPSEVVLFGITQRVYLGIWTVLYILLSSLSAFIIDAYAKKDLEWIRKTVSYSIKRTLGIGVFAVALISLLFPYITNIWLNEYMYPGKYLLSLFSIFVLINIWNYIHQFALQGLSQLNELLLATLLGLVIKAILSIVFVVYFKLGTNGVILSTVIAMIPVAIVGPIVFKRHLIIR